MESGANKVYICEPHGFIAKLAHAGVQRHTMITFEQENWARLPMNVGLAERVKDAGSIAFKAGQYERAISLYTEALPPTDSVPELKVNCSPTVRFATSSWVNRRLLLQMVLPPFDAYLILARVTIGWLRHWWSSGAFETPGCG